MLEKYDKKTVMLAHKGCWGCRRAQHVLKDEIDKNILTVLDVTEEDTQKLINKLKEKMSLYYVPTILRIEMTKPNTFKVCNVETGSCVEVEEIR
jgi:hypothetical protein